MEPNEETRSTGKALSTREQQQLRQALADPKRSDEKIARTLGFSVVGSTVSRYRKKWGFPTASQARNLDYCPLNELELKRVTRLVEMMTIASAADLEAQGHMGQDGREVFGTGTEKMQLETENNRVKRAWFTRGDERWLVDRVLCRSIFPGGRQWVRRYFRIRSRTIRYAIAAAGRGEFASMEGDLPISTVLRLIHQGEDPDKIPDAKRSYEVINEEPRLRGDVEEFKADLLAYFGL